MRTFKLGSQLIKASLYMNEAILMNTFANWIYIVKYLLLLVVGGVSAIQCYFKIVCWIISILGWWWWLWYIPTFIQYLFSIRSTYVHWKLLSFFLKVVFILAWFTKHFYKKYIYKLYLYVYILILFK